MSRLRAAEHVPRSHVRPVRERDDGTRGNRTGRSARPEPPVLEAAPGSTSQTLGRRLADRSPILVFLLTTVVGWLLLAGVMIGLGFLLVDVVLPIHVVGSNDEAVNRWFADHRTPALDDASYVGSSIGDIPFIPALVLLTALGAAILRRWRVFAFIVGAIVVEVATYRVTSLIVHRQRPAVPRLDHLPVNQSFPSGHVAASVVVYIGLALLISSKIRSRRAAIPFWALAIALPLVVAVSRMYRGMHHPIDAAAGILMGLAAIAIALLAARAAGEAWAVRQGPAARDGRSV